MRQAGAGLNFLPLDLRLYNHTGEIQSMNRFLIKGLAIAALTGMAASHVFAADPVKAAAYIKPISVTRGGHGTFVVALTISQGMHINANKPIDSNNIATTIKVNAAPGIKVGTPKYPAAKMITTSGIKSNVYTGKATVIIPFTVAKSAKPGKQVLKGDVTYQACNDKSCLPPNTITVSAPLTIK